MKSVIIVGWLIQTFVTTGLANPTLARHSHLHQKRAQQSASPRNVTLGEGTATASSEPLATGGLNSTQSSGLSGNQTLTNQTWYWIEPVAPQVVEDLFSPAVTGIISLDGTITPFNETISTDDGSKTFQEITDTSSEVWDSSSLDIAPSESVSFHASLKVAAVAAVTQRPKFVFAHFMVGNVPDWSIEDWKADIRNAQAAHIDAFALNMAADDTSNTQTLNMAFTAADALGFKLALSFDYAGGGPWPKNLVLSYIKGYSQRPSYYYYNGKAFMSTFEGWENAEDWIDIKKQANCIFLPDWSSRGAKDAMALAGGVADGLFSWAAWPWGNTDMNTYVDASYIEFLKGKLYMMPVSPWFYTNLPGFDGKNWIWRGDSLWHDRWFETLVVQPDFVQIISWNDYGESHYIGPLNNRAYGAFDRGLAPYNYVLDMPHDGWRDLLPFAIDLYKYNTTTFTKEILVTWYRKHPSAACTTGGTSGSTASQLLVEFSPSAVAQDMIFYSALLASDAAVVVTIGGVNLGASFQDKPNGGIGLYHGSVATGGRTGVVSVSISRSTGSLAITGKAITATCEQNIQNYNAWVGSTTGPTIPSKSPALAIHNMVCISGTGAGIFAEICAFTCSYGYCPLGACQCLAMGKAATKPASTGGKGYPQIGMSASFEGLCNFACNLGKCPSNVCRNTQVLPYAIFTVSPFLPRSCNRGTGAAPWTGLCSYACDFGYCPMSVCSCTGQGPLNQPPASDPSKVGYAIEGDDGGLCKFACSRTWCPTDVCEMEPRAFEYEYIDPKDYLTPCTDTYDSLDAIIAAGTSIPFHCYSRYMLMVQAKTLGTAISNYTAIMAAGYDGKYKTYARYIAELVWPSIKAFMVGDGKKYLSCSQIDNRVCCDECQDAWCGLNCRRPCTAASGQPVAVACPSVISTLGDVGGIPPAYIFTFTDRAAFFSELSEKYGIPESWTQIGDHRAWVNAGCGQNVPACFITWQNMILPANKIDVPNPKSSFSSSLTELTTLQATLSNAAIAEPDTYTASLDEFVDAADLPVSMSVNAITNMQAIVDKAEQIEDEERKNTILFFVTSLLMFVPVVGSGAAALGFATLRSIITIAGAAGDAALGIWSIVQDPSSAVFLIFAAVLGARDFAKAARSRKGMSDKYLDALGTTVGTSMRKTSKAKTDCYCTF